MVNFAVFKALKVNISLVFAMILPVPEFNPKPTARPVKAMGVNLAKLNVG